MNAAAPIWWARNPDAATPPADAPPPNPPAPLANAPAGALDDLLRRVQSGDRETLLLLGLVLLLWQDHADRRLLLALGYILL